MAVVDRVRVLHVRAVEVLALVLSTWCFFLEERLLWLDVVRCREVTRVSRLSARPVVRIGRMWPGRCAVASGSDAVLSFLGEGRCKAALWAVSRMSCSIVARVGDAVYARSADARRVGVFDVDVFG